MEPLELVSVVNRDVLLCQMLCVGKTLLAKAVANQTSATFLRVCGSELIQKYLVRCFTTRNDVISLAALGGRSQTC